MVYIHNRLVPDRRELAMHYVSCRNALFVGTALMILTVVCGCGKPPTSAPVSRATAAQPGSQSALATLDEVRRIVSEQMGVELGKLTPTTSLGELGSDELDFVELIMELEEHFNVTIPDEKATQMAGSNDWQQNLKNVTLEKLVAVVDELRRAPGTTADPNAPRRKRADGSAARAE